MCAQWFLQIVALIHLMWTGNLGPLYSPYVETPFMLKSAGNGICGWAHKVPQGMTEDVPQ